MHAIRADQATSAPPTSYQVRSGDVVRDEESVLGIWRGHLGDDRRMPAKYAWFYREAPAGEPMLKLLLADDRTVGACAAGRRRMLRDGKPVRGGVLVDLAVVPEHRSLGPALILQQALFATAGTDFDLLYGFPNPKAAPVFRRIGYRALGDLVRYVRVVRHARYLARRMPDWLARPAGLLADLFVRLRETLSNPGVRRLDATWHDRVDPRMQALWQASVKPDGFVGVRDVDHLSWRFDQAPEGGFRYLLLSEPGRDALCAWFATRGTQGTLHVHDFWSSHGPALGTRHVAALLRAARRDGHAAVSVELVTAPAHLSPWLAFGFAARGSRPIFGRWAATSVPDEPPCLHLTAADEDE